MNPRITSSVLPFELGAAQLVDAVEIPGIQPLIMTMDDSFGNHRVVIVDVCFN